MSIKQKKGWNNKQVAEHLNMTDPSLATRYLALFGTIPEVQAEARLGRIGVAAWYSISLLPQDQQAGVLELHRSGLPATQIAEISRKKRSSNNESETEKAKKVKLPLPGGISVVVSGSEISLDKLIKILQQSLEAVRKAEKDKLNIKTAQVVWSDLAKKQTVSEQP